MGETFHSFLRRLIQIPNYQQTEIMAEFLIKAVSVTHTNPAKDAGCWKRGDIKDVRPDGFQWGRKETLPNFVIVKIPGINAERAKKYLASAPGVRSRFRLRVDDIPLTIRNQLRDNGEVTVTWNQVRSFLRDKVTNLDESNAGEP